MHTFADSRVVHIQFSVFGVSIFKILDFAQLSDMNLLASTSIVNCDTRQTATGHTQDEIFLSVSTPPTNDVLSYVQTIQIATTLPPHQPEMYHLYETGLELLIQS